MNHSNAVQFHRFACSGRFLINGVPYFPQKFQANDYRTHISDTLAILDEMLYKGARRCITLRLLKNNSNGSRYVEFREIIESH